MRRTSPAFWLLLAGLFASHAAVSAVRYFDISGSTASAENACPAWVPVGNQDDCSYNASNPSTGGTAQWIGPVFSAGYYAPDQAPLIFTNPSPAGPITAPAPQLPLAGKTGIPIARGFISIDDKGTPEGTDDVIGGTIEFGPFERNVGTGPATRVIESFARIIHRVTPPAAGASNVSAATANAGGGFDYIVGESGGSAAFPAALAGSTTASGGFSDEFPSEVASQSSADPADTPYWSGPGSNGIASFEGAGAIAGASTTATVWGYTCTSAVGTPTCITSDVNWDADGRASFDNVLLQLSTDSGGSITSATAFLVNESDLSPAVPDADSWSGTVAAFTGTEDPAPAAFDDKVIFANGLDADVVVDELRNDATGVAPFTITIETPPTHGIAAVLGSPPNFVNQIGYTPTGPAFEGVDTIAYRITDANSDTSTGTIFITRTDPITCFNDTANGSRNASTTIAVLANDDGFDIPPVIVTIPTAPSQGSAVVNPDNTITFDPPADTSGVFTFDYRVDDGSNSPAECSVTINVEGMIAVDDVDAVEDFVTDDILVLTNDHREFLQAPIEIEITTPPVHGKSFVIPAGGSVAAFILYTADRGYTGTDTLRYRLRDAADFVTNEALVTITVSDATPVAVNDSATAEDGIETSIDVVANDTARGDTPLSLAITSATTHGTATVVAASGGGSPFITYAPTAGYAGPDSLQYTVTDSDGDVSNAATVTITVQDSSPVSVADAFNGDSRREVPFDVLANDTGLVDLPLTLEITQAPTGGTATIIPASGTTNGRPAIGYASNVAANSGDTLRYRVLDADGDASGEATVTISVTDGTPVAVDDTRAVEDGTTLSIGVLSNDTGRNNAPLTIAITQQPANGSVTVNAGTIGTPTLSYAPDTGFAGTDTFRYRFTDGDDQASNEALVTLNVADSAPVAVNDTANGDARESTAVDVLANDTGLADGPVTIEITGQPTNGTAELVNVVVGTGTRPGIAYASNENFSGSDTVRYRITDRDGDVSGEAVVTFAVANQAPVAVNDAGGNVGLLPSGQRFVIERIATPFDILRNDTGRGNRPITITITQQPAHGTAEIDPAEETGLGRPGVTYRSNAGYTGPDDFRYTFSDGDDQVSNEATVTFTVISVLTAQTDGSPFPLPTNRDRPLTVNVLDNDGGLAYGLVSVEIVSAVNGTATVNPDNTITFDPTPGFTGRYPSPDCPVTSCFSSVGGGFRYRLTDGANQTAEAAAFIDVFPPPVDDQGGSAIDEYFLGLLLAAWAVRQGKRRPQSPSSDC